MKKIVHIAPALPPAINGLGDFCQILAHNLERQGYRQNIYMVRSNGINREDDRTVVFDPGNFYDKLKKLKADVVMLHYVGSAYNKRGMPFYIVTGLRKYKEQTGCRVLVYFHELYSSSNSFLKLPFYTNRFQKSIVKQLCRIANVAFTNCGVYHELLKQVLDNKEIQTVCTGIFSNIPDDLYDSSIRKEAHSLVVFGSYHKRKAVYGNPLFRKLVHALEIDTIYDIGPDEYHFSDAGITLHRKGVLNSHELALYLNKVQYGALSYAPHLLGKSGIFSAYAAFGIIPVNLPLTDHRLYDGLVEGKNYFSWNTISLHKSFDHLLAREEILKWYRTHDQFAVAHRIKQQLG